jgi:U6 snRNA-associated Sm-like protein LSm1
MAIINETFLEYAVRASLVDCLDKDMIVLLRDGKKFIGSLRTFDQFSNIVMSNCFERVIYKVRGGG